MLDTMDWLFKDSFMFLSTQPSRDNMLRVRRPWDIMESDNELQIRFDLPSLSKEDVMMCNDNISLAIKGDVDS
ncbi:hypothetical protein SUGI_0547620 [Cryptomeria japonica]|nr:hypothetical protein SUGI_0547620 [Cryptomeria japonica]